MLNRIDLEFPITPDVARQLISVLNLRALGRALRDCVSTEDERTLPCNDATSGQLSDGAATAAER